MNKQEVTPWFPVAIKPARVGVYEVAYDRDLSDPCFRKWNGAFWETLGGARAMFGIAGDLWRGLTKEMK